MKKKASTWWKTKMVSYTTSSLHYFDCPHCKKPVVMSDPDAVSFLKKWKKFIKPKKSLIK